MLYITPEQSIVSILLPFTSVSPDSVLDGIYRLTPVPVVF